jgi:hypothetical protein
MRTIDRITTYVAAFGVLLSVVAFGVSTEVGIGALAGATIAIGDWLVTRMVGARLLSGGDRGRTMLSLVLVSKMSLVLGACAAVLWSGHVSALGFILGISAMVAGVVAGGVHESLAAPAALTENAPSVENK